MATDDKKLTFECAFRETGDKLALEEQEDDDYRQAGQHGASEQDAILVIIGTDEGGDAQVHDEHTGISRNDQGPEEIIPQAGKRENAQYCQPWSNQRQYNAPPDAKLGCAIHACGIKQLAGQADSILAHQENAEGSNGTRNNQALVGIKPVERTNYLELRHQQDLVGNEQRCQHEHKQDIFEAKIILCKGKASQRTQQDGEQRAKHGHNDRIEQPSDKGKVGKQALYILKCGTFGKEGYR